MRLSRLKGLAVGILSCLVMASTATSVSAAELSTEEPDPQTSSNKRPGQLDLKRTKKRGRTELVVFQTAHGLALGLESCWFFDCNGIGLLAASAAGGAGIGAGTSLLATRRGIRPGHAAALNSGVLWGAAYAGMVGVPTEAFTSLDPKKSAGTLMAGQLAGLGVGAGLYQWLEPTKADVAVVNSFGLWGAAFGIGAFTLMNEFPHPWAVSGTALATSTLAGMGGGFLAHVDPLGRPRMWTINGSGIAGGLVGAGVGYIFSVALDGSNNPSTLYGASVMAGTAAGLGVGAWLTDDWNRRQSGSSKPTAQLHLAPSPRGSGGMVQVSGSF